MTELHALFDFRNPLDVDQPMVIPLEDPDDICYVPKPVQNIVFLLDTSGSMSFKGGQRINQLNTAMPIILESLEEYGEEAEIDIFVRVIAFNDTATWVMGNMEQGVNIFHARGLWRDLSAHGSTDTAAAIRLARTAMRVKYLGARNYHPVVILVTDGEANDPTETKQAIEELRQALSGGKPEKMDKVWRIAVGVEDYNESELVNFAMTGTVKDEFGNEYISVPMVFSVEDVAALSQVLKEVSVGCVRSSAHGDDNPYIVI